MDQLYNHLPPSAPIFTPAAPMYQVPVHVFPTASSMSVQQLPHGEFAPGTIFPSVPTGATPTLYSNSPSSHLPYSQMITEAIGTLRERDGSSRQAIAKYIERAYPNLPANHWDLLTQHLKRMRESGELVMVKNSYVLAASAPGVLASLSENVQMESPGRPTQQDEAPVFQESPINASAGLGPVPDDLVSLYAAIGLIYDGSLDPAPVPSPVPKRRPGRPKKLLGPSNATTIPVPTEGGLPVKRRPGRPFKYAASVNVGTDAASVKRRPGRPFKYAALVNVGTDADAASVKRRPGRPRLNAGVYPGMPRGDGTVAVGRKRGRPGRPPRSANEPPKPRNLSGKPLGRPKKYQNAPGVVIQVSNLQQLLASQELKSKLEFFQSRLRHTVDILKPVLSNIQTASIASGALQELEELATLDVNVDSSLALCISESNP